MICKPAGEVIQQFWMRRLLAHAPEIVRSRYNSTTKEMMPDAVHDHACRQRIVRAQEILGQLPAAAFRLGIRRCINRVEKPAWHQIARMLVFAPDKERLIHRLSFNHALSPSRNANRFFTLAIRGHERFD